MSHKSDLETNRNDQVVDGPASSGRSPDALLMIAIGVLALLGGVALTVGPRVSWKLAQISGGFKYLGVEGGTLAMGGMLLAALGLIRRAIASAKSSDDQNPVFDHLASEVVQIHATIEEVETNLQSMREDLQSLHSSIEALTEAQRSTPAVAQTPSHDDGMFRIAASLDQLGARVEQRLKAQYDSMQESLDDLNDVVVSVRKNMDEMFAGVAEQNVATAEVASPSVDASTSAATQSPADDSEPYQAPLGLLDQLDDPAPAAPTNGADGIDREKLAALQSLLDDDRLRATVDQLRRNGQR